MRVTDSLGPCGGISRDRGHNRSMPQHLVMPRRWSAITIALIALVASACSPTFDGPLPPAPTPVNQAEFDALVASGSPAVVNVWASWCLPCRSEAPLIATGSIVHPNVEFIGLNVKDSDANAQVFMESTSKMLTWCTCPMLQAGFRSTSAGGQGFQSPSSTTQTERSLRPIAGSSTSQHWPGFSMRSIDSGIHAPRSRRNSDGKLLAHDSLGGQAGQCSRLCCQHLGHWPCRSDRRRVRRQTRCNDFGRNQPLLGPRSDPACPFWCFHHRGGDRRHCCVRIHGEKRRRWRARCSRTCRPRWPRWVASRMCGDELVPRVGVHTSVGNEPRWLFYHPTPGGTVRSDSSRCCRDVHCSVEGKGNPTSVRTCCHGTARGRRSAPRD